MGDSQNKFVPVDKALNIILEQAMLLGSERVMLSELYGRIVSEDVLSDINVPPFDNSAMDGYAVRHSDTAGAGPERPAHLTVVGEIQAGMDQRNIEVAERTAVRIMTGALLPKGADSVVPVEFTEEDLPGKTVAVFNEVGKNENIRFAGEDIKNGQVVLPRGAKCSSADIGLLASLNRDAVLVHRRPRVAIITTGDEIVEVGETLQPGQIRNSNAHTLSAEVRKYNGIPFYLGIAKDSLKTTKEKFMEALKYDIVISTGGVSLGKYDLVKDVLIDLGVAIKIETIKMKPGKPMIFGVRDRTLFFGLPGNPVSTMVSFIEFVRPALLKMTGAGKLRKPELFAVADHAIRKKTGRREFFRGYFFTRNGELHVNTTGPQGSGILHSMREANCLIVLPEENDGCAAGDRVLIQLIYHEEID
ncbi:MAG: molybdopterin molybdotransferase MoeA [Smithella sp.]|nr:molybdopterin molybdotransferase MoeA [Smithella sp.]